MLVLILVGNKCDLESENKVTVEEARTYANEINASFILTSCFTGEGTKELVEEVVKLKNEHEDNEEDKPPALISYRRGKYIETKTRNRNCCLGSYTTSHYIPIIHLTNKEKMKLWHGNEIKGLNL